MRSHGHGQPDGQVVVVGLEPGEGRGAAGVGGAVGQGAALYVEVEKADGVAVDDGLVGGGQGVGVGASDGQFRAGRAAEGDGDVAAAGAQPFDAAVEVEAISGGVEAVLAAPRRAAGVGRVGDDEAEHHVGRQRSVVVVEGEGGRQGDIDVGRERRAAGEPGGGGGGAAAEQRRAEAGGGGDEEGQEEGGDEKEAGAAGHRGSIAQLGKEKNGTRMIGLSHTRHSRRAPAVETRRLLCQTRSNAFRRRRQPASAGFGLPDAGFQPASKAYAIALTMTQ